MKLKSTFRSFNGSVYVRIPPALVEYYKLKEKISHSEQNMTEPECKIEDKDNNTVHITFPKWG